MRVAPASAAVVVDSNADMPEAPLGLSPDAIAQYLPSGLTDPLYWIIDTDPPADTVYLDRVVNAASADIAGEIGGTFAPIVTLTPIDTRAVLFIAAPAPRLRIRLFPATLAPVTLGVLRAGAAASFPSPLATVEGLTARVETIGTHTTEFGDALL